MARISKERKREKFVRVVYVDARRGNIFRACKPLKSRVIGQASPRGREWEGSLGGGEMTRERNEKRGEEQVNGPESVKEGAESERGESEKAILPRYIHNSKREEIGRLTRPALNLNSVCREFDKSFVEPPSSSFEAEPNSILDPFRILMPDMYTINPSLCFQFSSLISQIRISQSLETRSFQILRSTVLSFS